MFRMFRTPKSARWLRLGGAAAAGIVGGGIASVVKAGPADAQDLVVGQDNDAVANLTTLRANNHTFTLWVINDSGAAIHGAGGGQGLAGIYGWGGAGAAAGVYGHGGSEQGVGVHGVGAGGPVVRPVHPDEIGIGTGKQEIVKGGPGVVGDGGAGAAGVEGKGGQGGAGVVGEGGGTGYGVIARGGPGNGVGVEGSGGGSSAGVVATGGPANGNGVEGTGDGSGAGLVATGGGANGSGVEASGGSGLGPGVVATGGFFNGIGVDATGGGGGTGVVAKGGAGNGNGVEGSGGGSGAGVVGTGLHNGVIGDAISTEGGDIAAAGVLGLTGSTSQFSGGVVGSNSGGHGYGVIGFAANGTPRAAVYGCDQIPAETHLPGSSGAGPGVHGDVRDPANPSPGVLGDTKGDGAGVSGRSEQGVGAAFSIAVDEGGHALTVQNDMAQLELVPAANANSHPVSGKAGQLFVDKQARLWFCQGGTSWKRLV
jgi:hypothetical protein